MKCGPEIVASFIEYRGVRPNANASQFAHESTCDHPRNVLLSLWHIISRERNAITRAAKCLGNWPWRDETIDLSTLAASFSDRHFCCTNAFGVQQSSSCPCLVIANRTNGIGIYLIKISESRGKIYKKNPSGKLFNGLFNFPRMRLNFPSRNSNWRIFEDKVARRTTSARTVAASRRSPQSAAGGRKWAPAGEQFKFRPR